MKYLKSFLIMIPIFIFLIVCTPASKEMTAEDFLKMEDQIINTDRTPEAKEKILIKNNFTLKQYENFEKKLDADPKLKEKLGEIRSNMFRSKQK